MPYNPCTRPSDCGCDLLCVEDQVLGSVCEYPCTETSECPDLATVCTGTACQINSCGPGTGNGQYNSFCNVVGTNDGTCIPQTQSNGTENGICYQGGTATSACNETAQRPNLSEDCEAGSVCVGGAIGSGGFCGAACDPSNFDSCPAGQECALTVDDDASGACVPDGS